MTNDSLKSDGLELFTVVLISDDHIIREFYGCILMNEPLDDSHFDERVEDRRS